MWSGSKLSEAHRQKLIAIECTVIRCIPMGTSTIDRMDVIYIDDRGEMEQCT